MSDNAPPDSAAKAPRQLTPTGAIMLACFVGLYALFLANRFANLLPDTTSLDAALAIAALAASIATLSPPLATTNVLLAAFLAAVIGGIAVATSSVTGYPFGQMDFMPAAGPRLLGLIPWWLPAVWAAIALSSRGAARFLLYSTHGHSHHGYQVIAAATGMAMLSTHALHSFATHATRYWKPAMTDSLFFSSGHVLHLFIQIAITALLIDKFPGPRRRNYRPLIVWLGINSALAAGIFIT